MSANHSRTETSYIDRNQFLDVYPICSRLVSEIGRVFIRSWTDEQASLHREELVGRLIESGVSKAKAEIAWKLIVQDHAKSGARSAPNSDSVSAMNLNVSAANSANGNSEFRNSGSGAQTDENIFSFEHGRWVVRYLGQTIYPQDITGIKYLHCLIANPGVTFSPQELYNGFGGRKTRQRPKAMSAGDALRTGVGFEPTKPDVLIDQQGRKAMLARLESIESEMANAKLVPDADLIEKLVAERIGITAHLRKAFTPVGSRRIQEPDLVRRMKAVDIAIRRAKEKIQRAGHYELLRHLNDTVEVKVKSGCRYHSTAEPVWRTSAVAFIAPNQPR
ncbi:hypothetical protein [Mariniblastus fucicola]|uniref:Uncharacterized protein n=1 Tax=Mariniblastus fucicola TaxID=980251 RepID=A0A5B9PB75_9BACT|nr:hypothetical protein [Mariniblastus fucicola]QEG21766.1 hypothetical protein MFFC18_16250 [Mariniblastus fucicola]